MLLGLRLLLPPPSVVLHRHRLAEPHGGHEFQGHARVAATDPGDDHIEEAAGHEEGVQPNAELD